MGDQIDVLEPNGVKLSPTDRQLLSLLQQNSRRSVTELGAIGRNLNQIAKAANQGAKPDGPGREDLMAMLRVAEALRDHVKALLRANQISWLAAGACRDDAFTLGVEGRRSNVKKGSPVSSGG